MATSKIPTSVISAIRRNLVEFGYQVTLEEVTDQVDKIFKQEVGLTIIGLFARDMLEKAGYIKD